MACAATATAPCAIAPAYGFEPHQVAPSSSGHDGSWHMALEVVGDRGEALLRTYNVFNLKDGAHLRKRLGLEFGFMEDSLIMIGVHALRKPARNKVQHNLAEETQSS